MCFAPFNMLKYKRGDSMAIILASIVGYLFGSVPFALVIGKVFYKTDIREHGSGNLGGTNAGRTLGAKAGIAVSLLDISKATIAMTLSYFISRNADAILAAGFFATLGHCYPLFANFKGGKAVSTAVGFLLGITIFLTKQPLAHFIIPILITVSILYFTKMVSLAAMIGVTSATLILFLTQDNFYLSLAFAMVNIIVLWRHRANIKRIMDGNESKITWM